MFDQSLKRRLRPRFDKTGGPRGQLAVHPAATRCAERRDLGTLVDVGKATSDNHPHWKTLNGGGFLLLY